MKRVLPNKELKSFFILLSFSFLLILLDRFQCLNSVKAYSEKLLLPPKKSIYRNWQEVEDRARDRVRVKNNGKTKELEEKIKELEQKIAQLTAHSSQLTVENKAAKRLLGTLLPADWQFIPAQTAGLVDGILTIDKGQINGVKTGQAVLVEDIFVGKVDWVGEHTSKVELPVAEGSKLLAKVIPDGKQGNTETLKNTEGTEIKAKGILVGYGDKMRLEKVLQEEQLGEGDIVVTGEFPPNLVIGKITKVIKKDVEIYQETEVKPLVDYEKLEVVFLLK